MSKKVKVVGTKFRPSNADRYLNCPASVVMAKDIPVDDGTVYSDTGTVAHALAENCIEDGTDATNHVGKIVLPEYESILVDEDMAYNVQGYLDWIKDQGFSA